MDLRPGERPPTQDEIDAYANSMKSGRWILPGYHELKTWPWFFDAIVARDKTFDVRFNDRHFRSGDVLRLREWDPCLKVYTGHEQIAYVTYVLNQPPDVVQQAIAEGYVVLGLRLPWPPLKGGIAEIAAERTRQIKCEGFDELHDDEHGDGSLARAALAYLYAAVHPEMANATALWPWRATPNAETVGFKPSPDPARNLVKAAALIAAELDRLSRWEAKPLAEDAPPADSIPSQP